MLKKRIIPIQLLKDGRLVKGKQFSHYRDVGDPITSSAVYNSQLADELIFLNTNSELGILPLLDIIDDVSKVVFMPLSFGGGIRSFQDAAQLIEHGADKVILNSISYESPEIIQEISNTYGNQAVIVCIDVRSVDGEYQLYSHNGSRYQACSLQQHISRCAALGAGEIMLQSIDLDGSMLGFDSQLAIDASQSSNMPIILAGGSGNYEHLKQAFLTAPISAIACGSLFNFSDSNPMRANAFLKNHGIALKLNK